MLICQTVGVQCIDERTMPDNMEDLLVVRPQVLRSVKKQRAEAPTDLSDTVPLSCHPAFDV